PAIVVRAGVVGRGEVFVKPLRKTRNATIRTIRNYIADERLPCRGIDNRCGNGRKVAGQELWIHYRSEQGSALSRPQSFICAEEECLAMDNRPTGRGAELIATEFGLLRVNESASVQVVIAEELVNVPMNIIRAGTRDGGHHRLPLPELGRESVAVDFELLHGIDVELDREIVEAQRAGHDAIDQVVGRRVAPTFDGDVLVAPAELCPALKRLGRESRRQPGQL